MDDLPPDANTGTSSEEPTAGGARRSGPATPRWVPVLGIIAVILILAFFVQLFLGGHGPGMHGQLMVR
jgi:hypothetical protein